MFSQESWLDAIFYIGVVTVVLRFRWGLTRMVAALMGGIITYIAGCTCNFVAAMANGWRMPAVVTSPGYVLITASTHLAFLGDRFAIVSSRDYATYASVGDLLVWSGELAIVLTFLLAGVTFLYRLDLGWSKLDEQSKKYAG